MKYAHIDSNGRILGWYDKDIHETIPTPNIEVTEDAYLEIRKSKHNTIASDGVTSLVDYRTEEEIAEQVRAIRDMLLQESDQFALADRSMTDAMATYRQALRDITTQVGFPTEVIWPEKP
jgi:hypothetical protein